MKLRKKPDKSSNEKKKLLPFAGTSKSNEKCDKITQNIKRNLSTNANYESSFYKTNKKRG